MSQKSGSAIMGRGEKSKNPRMEPAAWVLEHHDFDDFMEMFETLWFRPEQVLAKMPPAWETSTRERWLIDRLQSGVFRCVARLGPHPDRGISPFPFIYPDYWQTWSDVDQHHFWATGDINFPRTVASGSIVEISFFDVRFPPHCLRGLPSLDDDTAIAAKSPLKSDDPPVSTKPLPEAALVKWVEAFRVVHPRTTEEMASNGLAATFPDFTVSRERLRRVLPPRPIGRPRKNSD